MSALLMFIHNDWMEVKTKSLAHSLTLCIQIVTEETEELDYSKLHKKYYLFFKNRKEAINSQSSISEFDEHP